MIEEPAGISARISRYTRWFACAVLMVMTAIIGWQVFARYVLNASPAWAEQAALLLMIWYVLFAAAAGVREGFHIRIGVFETALAPDGTPFQRAVWNRLREIPFGETHSYRDVAMSIGRPAAVGHRFPHAPTGDGSRPPTPCPGPNPAPSSLGRAGRETANGRGPRRQYSRPPPARRT